MDNQSKTSADAGSTAAPEGRGSGLDGARAVVTGGDGFLGRHLVAALSGHGAEILVVDDGRSGREPMESPPGCARVWSDFRDQTALRAIREFDPTVVFHLAAMHFVPDCDREPTACLDNNVLGTERLLAALRKTSVDAVVFCSSAVVYGFAEQPRRETDDLTPKHIYAHSKWLGEGLMRSFHQDRTDVRVVSARLFNLIGPGDTARHVIPEIVDAVAAGHELQLGNVWPRRDYIHVADVASALCALAVGEPVSTAVNVGTGVGRSVADALDTLAEIMGHPPVVHRDPARERSTDGHLVADVTLLSSLTGWQPEWTFEATLRELLSATGSR